jgi:multidrug efflux pump subunit AcrA (membrane-fusion protein)
MKRKTTTNIIYKKIIATLAVASLCVSLAGCTAADAAVSEEAKIPVSVTTIQKGAFETYARNSAKVLAGKEIMIVPKVSGTVQSVNFDIGQKVSSGDVLFVIDDTDISLQAAQAEAGYLAAKANYDKTVGGGASQQLLQLETAAHTAKINLDNAQLSLTRTEELYNIGAVSLQSLEAAQSGFDLANQQYQMASENLEITKSHLLKENEQAVGAALKQAKAAWDMAKRQLANTVVTAQIDGIVGMCTIAEGSVVGPQGPVMSVVDISKVTVEFGVSDSVINLIEAGKTKVELTFGALGDKKVNGTVKAVSPTVGAQTMTYLVKVEIENPDHSIKPGMFASIRVVLNTLTDAVSVPLRAVFTKNGASCVYVVKDGRSALREVATGISNETDMQIIEGLEEGETVVVRGQNLLEDGTPVVIAEQ